MFSPSTTTPLGRRNRRRAGALTTATIVAAGGLFVAGAPAASAKGKQPAPAKCRPGAIKESKDGFKQVCDSSGTWVPVINLTASGDISAQIAQGVFTEGARSRTTAPQIHFEAKKGSGAGATCDIGNGITVNEGDVVDYESETRDAKGNLLTITHHKEKCGSDGKMHDLPARVVATAQVVAVLQHGAITQIQVPPTTVAASATIAVAQVGALR